MNQTQQQVENLRTLRQSFHDLVGLVNGISATMYKGVPIVSQEGDATIAPNVWNVWGEVTSLTITKGTDIAGIVNNYMIRFTAGVGTILIFNGENVKWYGGNIPEWVSGNTYEISIVDNIALWAEIEV